MDCAKGQPWLIDALNYLTEIGNAVVVVSMTKDIMLAADYIGNLGRGAGKHSGHIISEGTQRNF